jgi:hypothetical protein
MPGDTASASALADAHAASVPARSGQTPARTPRRPTRAERPQAALIHQTCTEIGRDPVAITRSIHLHVSYDQPDTTRDAINEALDAGFRHLTLGLPARVALRCAPALRG